MTESLRGRPVVSVVVPARNASQTIKNTLASILTQSYKNLEVLVVDDDSVDGTRDVLASINDSRLAILDGNGKGVSHARNIGLNAAKGKYVMFVDADDELEFDVVAKAVFLIEEHCSDMVIGGICKVWPDRRRTDFAIVADKPVEYRGESIAAIIEATIGYSSTKDPRLDAGHFTGCWCRLIMRERLEGLSFVESLPIGEDTVFNVALLIRCRSVVVTSEIWYRYHQNAGSVINRYRPNAFQEGAAMLMALKDEVGNNYSEALKRRALFQLEGAVRQSIDPGCSNKSVSQRAHAIYVGLHDNYWSQFLSDSRDITGLSIKHRVFLFLAKRGMARSLYFLLSARRS